jgi:colanic acid/amylovoran biosynthesis glycosyltransferase
MSAKVLIFTKRVLPRSNTFVAAQANNLSTFEPVFIGLRPDNGGADLIGNRARCVQSEVEPFPAVSRLLLDGFQVLTPKWAQALAAQKAQLIHAHFGKGGYYCAPIANKLNLPLITTFHGSDITQQDKLSYNKKHRDIVFSRSDNIIAISRFIQQKLLERGCPEHKIIQHYTGIDTKFFAPSNAKFTEPTVLFVGRLIEQKGCQYLIQAMQRLLQQLPDARLIVAGYGNYAQVLQDMAAQNSNISFVGMQNQQQVKTLMSKAWLTCVPSIVMARGNEEGMGSVCVESQAVGTPVVAFDTGGIREAVIDQQTGLLSEQKNVAQLSDNLLALLQSASLRQQLSQAGIAHVDRHFNIRRQCAVLEQVYRTLC